MEIDLLQTVRDTVAAHRMLAPGERVLVALSGGADSVALLRALSALEYEVHAFHLNHGLRGAEADRDEAFVRTLCDTLRVPLTVEHADVRAYAAETGQSIEAAARELRYQRLHACACGDKIATAHTADDHAETVLFHLARGTGPKGLTGIPPVRDGIVRPLIDCSRVEVEGYLSMLGQDFVTDSTNFDTAYTRNRIRHEIMPVLREVNPRLTDAVARLSALLRQDEIYLAGETERLLMQAAQDGGWSAETLKEAPAAIKTRALREILHRAGVPPKATEERHIALVCALLHTANPSAALDLPGGRTAWREYGVLRVGVRTSASPKTEIQLTVPFEGQLWDDGPRLRLRLAEKDEVFYNSFNTFYVDCGTITLETLTARPRRTGDRLQLTANGGSRTLKKLMIDRRIPQMRRDELAVLTDENGIIAVQAIGIDHSRRPQGGRTLEIQFEG